MEPEPPRFALHPQLAADTLVLGDWPLCRLLRMNDASYPWFILVPRVAGVSEVYALTETERAQLWAESDALSRWMVAEFSPKKLNIAALGNMVPQLHIHHVARFENDASWPAPIWGRHAPVPLNADQLLAVRERTARLVGLQAAR